MVLDLYLGVVVWARKYFYTSDMALRPSSLHLLNTYNLPEAAPCTEINKNKIWVWLSERSQPHVVIFEM